MKKRKNLPKNNKKWKWTGYSLFLILFGTSAIINISYLPKYFTLKHQQEETQNKTLNINVSAYDENSKELFSFHYQTILSTLGNLMAQDTETYTLKNYGGSLGRYLYAINYYDENGEEQTKEQTNSNWWAIYYTKDGKDEMLPVGIDNFYFHNNENIKLHYSAM